MLPPTEQEDSGSRRVQVLGWFKTTPRHIQAGVLIVPLAVCGSILALLHYCAQMAGDSVAAFVREQTGQNITYSEASFSLFPSLGLVLSQLQISPVEPPPYEPGVAQGIGGKSQNQADRQITEAPSQNGGRIQSLGLERLSLALDVPALWEREVRIGHVNVQGVDVRVLAPDATYLQGSTDESSGLPMSESDQGPNSTSLVSLAGLAQQLQGVWQALPLLVDVHRITLDGFRLAIVSARLSDALMTTSLLGKVHVRLTAYPQQKNARLHFEVEDGMRVDFEANDGSSSAGSVRDPLSISAAITGSGTFVLRSEGAKSSLVVETFGFEARGVALDHLLMNERSWRVQLASLRLQLEAHAEGYTSPPSGCVIELRSDGHRAQSGPDGEPQLVIQPCALRSDLLGFELFPRGAGSAQSAGVPTQGPVSLATELHSMEPVVLRSEHFKLPVSAPLPKLRASVALVQGQSAILGEGRPNAALWPYGAEPPPFATAAAQVAKPLLASLAVTLHPQEAALDEEGTRPDLLVTSAVCVRPAPLVGLLKGWMPQLVGPETAHLMHRHSRMVGEDSGLVLRTQVDLQLRKQALALLFGVESAKPIHSYLPQFLEKAAPRLRMRVRTDWQSADGPHALRRKPVGRQTVTLPPFADFLADLRLARNEFTSEIKARGLLGDGVLAGLPVSAMEFSAESETVIRNGASRAGALAAIPWQSMGFEGFGGGTFALDMRLSDVQMAPQSQKVSPLQPAGWLPAIQSLTGGQVRVQADLAANSDLDLRQFVVTVDAKDQNSPLVRLELKARVPAKRDRATIDGELGLSAEHDFLLPQMTPVAQTGVPREQQLPSAFRGQLILPLRFTVLQDGHSAGTRAAYTVRLNAAASADISRLSLPGVVLTGLRGQLPLEQNIRVTLWDANLSDRDAVPLRLEWAPVLAENPFRRANGQEVAGMYSAARNIVLQKLEWMQKAGPLAGAGPFSATVALKQNQIMIDAVDADIFGGQISGFSFFNVDPERVSVSFSGRLSQLDGAQIFGLSGLPSAEALLNGRAALSYTFADSRIEGRLDLGAVPRPLLERLIARSDPNGADSKMGLVRRSLGIARPGRLGVDFRDGVADLSLELLLLGGGVQTMRVPDLPVTSFLESRVAPLRHQVEETLRTEPVPRSIEQQPGDKEQEP